MKIPALCALPTLVAGTLSVFGHLVPDTDTIISAIVYAWELNSRNITAQAYRLGELNPETAHVLSTLKVDLPPLLEGPLSAKTPVAIVDTNNPAELPVGIEKASIHSIVDHHKLSGLTNAEPLEIDMRPLCSAGSILYARAKAFGLPPPKHIAGLMLAGLLSDSLEFRSPTTTDTDRVFAKELGVLAGLDVSTFATGMLDAKAQIDHLTPDELVMMDTKIFELRGRKIGISVLETTQPAALLDKQVKLIVAQQNLITKEELDDMLLFVVDILHEVAIFISATPTSADLVEKAWACTVAADGTAFLPGVLSRKKQMIPALEAALSSAEL